MSDEKTATDRTTTLPPGHVFNVMLERLRGHVSNADTPRRKDVVKAATDDVLAELRKHVDGARARTRNVHDPEANALDDAIEMINIATGRPHRAFSFPAKEREAYGERAAIYVRKLTELSKSVEAVFEDSFRASRTGLW